jgi:hypothetical protein
MMSRRRFLTYFGIGTYALLRNPNLKAKDPDFPLPRRRGAPPSFFTPIKPTSEDDLVLPKGFSATVLCAWNEPLGTRGPLGDEHFGFDCDFLAYFPIDALNGGSNQNEGLLWVNHENANPVFVSEHDGKSAKTEAQVQKEKLAVGGSVIHIERGAGGWRRVHAAKHTRRLTALYPKIALTGPAASIVPEAVGTLANCSGGVMPWHTALSCEENFQEFNGPDGDGDYRGLRWAETPGQKIDENQYGWVLEVDPFGELPPLKHSALGRFCHENCAWRLGKTGRLVIYMGDDASDQYLYKFVSADRLDAKASRTEQRQLLTAGTLYAADFLSNRWLPLDLARSQRLKDAGFKSQAEVLMDTRKAAEAAGATRLDRPEDCEIHPNDGALYMALTNNRRHGNVFGQIVRLLEDKDNPEGTSFRYEILLAGGPQTGLACPDNLTFDRHGNLWVACDISTKVIGKGPFEPFGNNGLFVVPTTGPSVGEAFQFASGPVDCELTGPWFNAKGDTLFLSVQHPGATTKDLSKPTSRWPKSSSPQPRPAVVAITGF